MKKLTSIVLSIALIISTMTVLMILPASATTAGVAAITATEGGVVDTDSVTVGETATIVATPYFGNTFAGWFDSEGQLVSKQAAYTGKITDSLTAKFNVLNQIVDGSFENGTAGQDYFNLASGSNAGKNNVIADTPTPGNALHGDKVLACTPTAAANTAQYLIYMPLTVKKNTQYAFHMSFYMPTTSVWKYIGLYGNNDGYANSWTAYGTLAAWSYDYCAESQTSGVAWRYAGNQSASAMFAKAMGANTMGADDWYNIWILIDTGDDATIFPDGDTGEIYLSFGTLNNNTDTFYIDNVSFAEVTDTQATYTATAGEGGTVTADGDVSSSLRSVWHYNTSGSTNGSAGSANMVAASTRYSKSVTAVKKYTAVAYEGYTFDGWYDDTDNLVSTNATAELLMYGNYTAKFAQPLAAGNGGVLADNEDGTVTAKPYYGNTFDGWYKGGVKLTGGEYDTDTVTADGKYGVTAKFNVYNQIVDGSFENGTAGQDYFNLYSDSNAGQNNSIAATPTPGNALHGDKVLNCVPKVASTTENYLLYIPVTVKKNTQYAFHLSYYMPTTKVFKYIGLKPNNSHYSNSWTPVGTVAKWSMHWATEGATNESAWSYMGNQSAGTIHGKIVNANVGISADSWTDVWVLIDTGEDASIFDSGDTAEIWMTFGTANNDLNNFYIDNVSFAEVSDTDTTGTATAGEGGSVTLDKELSSSLRPVLHFDTNGSGSGDAYNTHIVAGSTRYSLAKTAVRQYTATPDSGYAFAGWYNDSDVLVSTNATAELNMSGNYTAKFVPYVSAGEGGVLADNGDGTVTAKPHYGNTFLGWYKGENLISSDTTIATEGLVGVVAKFGAYNQIVDGSFENGGNPTYLTGSATSQVMTDTDGNKFVRVTSGQNFTAFSYRFNVEKGKKYLVSYKLRDGMDENGNKLSGANAIIRRQIRPVNSAGTDYDWAGLHFASQSGYTFGSLINTYNSAADLLPNGGFYLNPVDQAAGADYLEKYVRSGDEWVTYSYILDATTLLADSTNLFAGGHTAQLGIVLGVFDAPTAVMDIDDVLVSEITDSDIYPTIGANPADGSGTYTMTAPAKTAGLPVSYIAYPAQFYTFDGWYNGETFVSADTVYATTEPVALTPKFVKPVAADKGGVLTDNGDGTVTARPFYGNSFDGWYKGGEKLNDGEHDTDTVIAKKNYNVTAKFNVYNLITNGDLEYDDNIDMVASTTNRFSIRDYTQDEGRGNHYLALDVPRQETSHSAFVLPVKKNTDYTISFDLKITDFGANGWFRMGMAYELGNWSSTAVMGGVTQTYTNPKTGHSLVLSSAAGQTHQPGDGIEKAEYLRDFDGDWIRVTVKFNSGADANVFGTGDEGTLYLMCYTFKNAMKVMFDNIIFGSGAEVKTYVKGYGAATADKSLAMPGDTVTYTAVPDYGSRFTGWYFAGERVSEDSVFSTDKYLSLTAMFTNYATVSDPGFERGTTGDFVARYDTVSFENIAHTGSVDTEFGSRVLKVTDNATDYLDFYLPAKAEANTKYLIHLSYKVEAATNTRTDIMVGPSSSWSSFTSAKFYASSAQYSFSPDGNTFGQYPSDNLKAHFGDGFIEMNIIVNTANELKDGNLYLLIGAKDGATFYIDNVSVTKLEDVVPHIIGATLVTETSSRYNEGALSYVSGLRYISPAHKLTEIGTIAMPTQLIPQGSELTLETANVSKACLINAGGLNFDAKKFYATFRNADTFPVSVKLSARSYVVMHDKYGKFDWTFYSENNNPSSNIKDGVYDRSITQIRRLLALALIENFEGQYPDDFYSEDDVSETDNVKSSASVSSAEAWNFVKRNTYLYGSSTEFTVESDNELWINGDFEDTSAYLGSIRRHTMYTQDEIAQKYSFSYNANAAPHNRGYDVIYDYDPYGWLYYTGGGYYIPNGYDNTNFSNYIDYVDSSVVTPHSGDYSLKLSTRSGTASYIMRDLRPDTEYELSFYWKGATTISLDNAWVYPYVYEYTWTTKVTDSSGNQTYETIDGQQHAVSKFDNLPYCLPKPYQLDAEALAYRDGPYMGDGAWQKVTMRFNSGNDTAAVLGLAYSARVNVGTIYLDDISLKECAAAADNVTDGSFQSGLKYWSGNASTYKIGGYSSASFTKAGQRLYQTVAVDRMTDYTLTVKAKTRERGALHFGVTDSGHTSLNALTALSNTAHTVTDGTGTDTYTVSFNSGSYNHLNLHLSSLVDSKVTILSVELAKAEKSIVYQGIDFDNGVTQISSGTAPNYNIAKTNHEWYNIYTGVSRSGSSSLRMAATSSDTNANTDFVTADGETLKHPLYQEWSCFKIKPGTYYKLSYYAKSNTAGNSFDSSIRYLKTGDTAADWNYLKALDSKTVNLGNTDWTYVEHVFSLDTGFNKYYYVNFVLSANNGTNADIFFDDIVFEECVPLIESTAPDKLYCEESYNLIPDESLENGGADFKELGGSLMTDGGYKGSNYLRVTAGKKIVLPIKTYVEYDYDPAVIYTFAAAVRASSGGSGYVGISYSADGNGFYVNSAGAAASKITADGTAWRFSGFSYLRETVTPTYLVIECQNGYIDVDALALFTDKHAFATDPNVASESTAITTVANGGTAQAGAVSLNIANASAAASETFTGLNKTVYHAFVSDCMGREYNPKQLEFELNKMKEAGITTIRTMLRSEWAYTGDETNPWDWNSKKMNEFYNWCQTLEDYGFEVAILLGWSLPYFIYGATSIPEVSYLAPRALDANGQIQYTISWGIVHPAIDFELACARYAEWGTQAIKAIYEHGVTNVTHALTFNEPSNVNGTLYTGAHNVQMLQLVDTLVDRMNEVKLDNGRTVRENIKLVGSNQANLYNAGLSDYFLENSKYGIDLYDVWTTHYVQSDGDNIGTDSDFYDNALDRYTRMMTNYLGRKPFWLDEFGCQGFNYDNADKDNEGRWWGVSYASQYAALINSGMSGGILWQYADNSWSYLGGSGGEFMYGIHMTGATHSALQTQTPYYSYYAVTLLTKYLSNPQNSQSFKGTSSDSHVHTAAVKMPDGNWSILVVNNNEEDKAIRINTASSLGSKTIYRHVYDSKEVTPDSTANILQADKAFTGVTTSINDTIPAGSVVVYTSIQG